MFIIYNVYCTKTGPGFPMSYVMFFLMFNELRREVIVGVVDIGGSFILSFHNLLGPSWLRSYGSST